MILHFSNDDPTYTIQDDHVDIEMAENNDLWVVKSIYELQYYNCPGCTFKHKSKQEFVNHLYFDHPEGILTLNNIKDESLRDKSSMKKVLITSLEASIMLVMKFLG